jgi:MFS family permease
MYPIKPSHRRADLRQSQPTGGDHPWIDFESRRHRHAGVRDNVEWFVAAAIIGGFGTGAAQLALMTLAVDQSAAERRGQSLAQFQFFYDLSIGVGALTLGALLDLVNQSFLIMYLATAAVALIGLWINWRRGFSY